MKSIFLIFLFCFSTTFVESLDNRTQSPHFNNGKFTNGHPSEKTFWDFIKIRIKTDYAQWPQWIESHSWPAPVSQVQGDKVTLTHINHSTFLIQTQGINLLTDPIYSKRCSPVSFAGPKRVRKPGIPFKSLPKIDIILISHDHYDHLDQPTLQQLVKRDNPKIYAGLGVGKHLNFSNKVIELDWWQHSQWNKYLTVHFVPVQHFSGRGFRDRSSTLWGGFILEIGKRKIYFGGDSGYANHYVQTFQKFGIIDIALLPIGAYAPRSFMSYAHMDPKEAVQAHLDLNATKSIGMHYGTFQLTAESINEPVQLLELEKQKAGIQTQDFITLEFGQPWTFDTLHPQN